MMSGPLGSVAVAFAGAQSAGTTDPLLIFEDETGKQIDVDTRGSSAEIEARYRTPAPAADVPRGPGRPRLGVVAREVTLLPGQWEWLASQPGGASVTLRKLVEQARKHGAADERVRTAREATYRFLSAIGGNLPDYEEVTRALFAGRISDMEAYMHAWPADVRVHALAMLERLTAPASGSP